KLKLDNNLSNAQFQKIRLAHVTIVGVGGLGCAAALELCSFGVNTIKIIDGDRVEAHNLYRQTLFNTQHCGLNKALVAQEILQNKFPFSQIEAQPNFLNLHNAQTFIQKTDLIIDCTDRLEMRYLINDVAVLNN